VARAPLYAIGDVHGQFEMLLTALSLIEAEGGADAQIVFVGDYTDRGPDSRAVVRYLKKEDEAGRPWVLLKGNHDIMFTRFVRQGVHEDAGISSDLTWLHHRLGGNETLASYVPELPWSVDEISQQFGKLGSQGPALDQLHQLTQASVPEDHLTFLENRPLIFETDDLLFVHAGVRPGIALADQSEADLVWIRQPFFEQTTPFEKLIVHGHTAYDHPTDFGNRVGIDGGAGYFRPLIPLVCEGRDVWQLTPQGRQPVARA